MRPDLRLLEAQIFFLTQDFDLMINRTALLWRLNQTCIYCLDTVKDCYQTMGSAFWIWLSDDLDFLMMLFGRFGAQKLADWQKSFSNGQSTYI